MEENNTPQSINQTPPAQTPPTPLVSTPLKPKGKKTLLAIIGTVLFLLIAGGGVAGFMYKDKLSNLVSKPTPTPPVTVSPTTKPDPTAGWLEYENTYGGFKLKLPPGWTSKNDPNFKDDERTKLTYYYSSDYTEVSPETPGGPVREISKGQEMTIRLEQNSIIKSTEDLKESSIVINQKPNLRYAIDSNDCYSYFDGVFYGCEFYKNGKIYKISFRSVDNSDTVFNQILSTFKFTDSQTIDTSTWKTYSNARYGFSLKYPAGYAAKENTNFSGLLEKIGILNINITTLNPLPGGGYPIAHVDVFIYSKDTPSLDEWIKRHTGVLPGPESTASIDPTILYFDLKNKKQIIVANKPAISFNAVRGEGGKYIVNLIDHGNYYFLIVFDNDGESHDPDIKNYFPSILSSFKFTQ